MAVASPFLYWETFRGYIFRERFWRILGIAPRKRFLPIPPGRAAQRGLFAALLPRPETLRRKGNFLMKKYIVGGLFVIAAGLCPLTMAGCESKPENKAEEMVDSAADAAEDAKDTVEDAAEDAKDAAKDAAEEAGDAIEDATD